MLKFDLVVLTTLFCLLPDNAVPYGAACAALLLLIGRYRLR